VDFFATHRNEELRSTNSLIEPLTSPNKDKPLDKPSLK
jgi:hypothetical protein